MSGDARAARAWEDAHPFRTDLAKYHRITFGPRAPTLRERIDLWLGHDGLHCVAAYRLSRRARSLARGHRWARPALVATARAAEQLLELVHHVRIWAEIGPGLYIGHAGMIRIGPTTIGRNFSVTHGVTIGYGQTAGAPGVPVIGDDVWVGTASVLSGAIRVGDGVTIANGTMLSRSVPARALAGGNPGRVVMQGYDNSALFRWAGERARSAGSGVSPPRADRPGTARTPPCTP